jgi:hypothetical protein
MSGADRLSIDDAIEALGVADPHAREWSEDIVRDYRAAVTGGQYKHKVKFQDLRQALREEAATMLGLAKRMKRQTEPLQALLEHFQRGVSQEAAIYHRRVGLIERLDAYVAELAALDDDSRWPKGGRGDLLKTRFRSPTTWLVQRCIQVFFRYRKEEISAAPRSPFRDYVHAIYEAATGEAAETPGNGLNKAIDAEVREFNRRYLLPPPIPFP